LKTTTSTTTALPTRFRCNFLQMLFPFPRNSAEITPWPARRFQKRFNPIDCGISCGDINASGLIREFLLGSIVASQGIVGWVPSRERAGGGVVTGEGVEFGLTFYRLCFQLLRLSFEFQFGYV
jgi:hypothetical protein